MNDSPIKLKLPANAQEFFAPLKSHAMKWIELSDLKGLMFDGLYQLDASPVGPILLTADFDVDTDGPGGSRQNDACWQADTSLRWPDGTSVNSRQFPGYVMPPAYKNFGVRLGDFGLAYRNGNVGAFQVYDFGPADKAGEGSVYLARVLGVVPSTSSDHKAATFGNDATDVSVLIFPRSAPGTGESLSNHALAPRLIELTVGILAIKYGLGA